MTTERERRKKKRESQTLGAFLILAGAFLWAATLGLLSVVARNGVVTGTLRGGSVEYEVPGAAPARTVGWFHSSGRDVLREGDPVPVILFPGGAKASSKHPYRLALYCALGGGAGFLLGGFFLRFA